MSNEITRTYSLSDAILLTHIGKVLVELPGHLPQFESIVPKINQAFVDGLIADHISALEEGGDDAARGELGSKTQALVNEMEISKGLIKKLRFWIGEAFQDDPAKHKSFHLSKFWKVANNQPKLIQYMNMLSSLVNENSAALLAVGATQQLIDDLTANAKALMDADAVQETSKSGRASSTQARIQLLNSLYDRVQLLDGASELVFEGDQVTIDFYGLPVVRPKAEDLESEPEVSI